MAAEYSEAKTFFQESLAICQEIGDRRGTADCFNHLGEVAQAQGLHQEAKDLYLESLIIFKEIGNHWGVAESKIDLGYVTCALREYQVAREHFAEALKITREIQAVPLALDALLGMATLRIKTKNPNQVRILEILMLILNHPTANRTSQDKAARLLADLEPYLPTGLTTATNFNGQIRAFEAVVEEVLNNID